MRLIVAGRPGAGKTTVAHAVADALDCTYVNVGDALQAWLPAAVARHRIGPLFLERYSVAHIGEAILERAEGRASVVIDGVRLWETWIQLRDSLAHSHLWFVDVSASAAQDRLRERIANDDSTPTGTAIDAALVDYGRYDRDLDWLKSNAACVYDGSGDVAVLRSVGVQSAQELLLRRRLSRVA